MSSIYKNLSEESLKLNKGPLPSMDNPAAPKMTGLKIAIVLAFLLSLAALLGAGFLYRQVNAEKRQREALEASQVQIQERAASFEKVSAQYHEELDRMREQLKNYAGEREDFIKERIALNKEIEQSKIQIVDLQKKIQELEDRNKPELQTVATLEVAPVNAVPAEEKAATGKAVSAAPAAASAIKGKKEAVASVPPEAKPVEKTPQILTVNRKFNFVVVNLGLKDKIKMGDQLSVERDKKEIGQVQVEKLYDNFSAATILKEDKNAPLKEGDLLRKPSS